MFKKVFFFFGVVVVCFGILWVLWLTQDEMDPYTGVIDRGLDTTAVDDDAVPLPEFVITKDLDTIAYIETGVTYYVDSLWFNEEEELATCFEVVSQELLSNEGSVVHIHSFFTDKESEDDATSRIDTFVGQLMTKGVKDAQVDLLFVQKKLESGVTGVKGGLEVYITTDQPL